MVRSGAELLGSPRRSKFRSATSLSAYSLVPEDHPLYVGVPGTYSRSCANKILARADLVLFVGSQTGEQVTHGWRFPPARTRVIQIGIDPRDLGRNYPNVISLQGDARVALELLTGEAAARRDSWIAEVRARVDEWRAEVQAHRNSDAVPMRPERISRR